MSAPGAEPNDGSANEGPPGHSDAPHPQAERAPVADFGSPPGEFGRPPSSRLQRFRPDLPSSRDVLGAIIVGIGLIIAGVPLGLLWGATTPKLDIAAALGAKTGVVEEAAFNTQAGVDVHFALIALIFGVVAGAFVGWRTRTGSWPLPLALAIGGVAGSLVAVQVGRLLESNSVLNHLSQSERDQLSPLIDFTLRSHGFYLVFPLAALIVYLLIVAIGTRSRPPQLPAEPEPGYWSAPR